jgi:hypothetical protein
MDLASSRKYNFYWIFTLTDRDYYSYYLNDIFYWLKSKNQYKIET